MSNRHKARKSLPPVAPSAEGARLGGGQGVQCVPVFCVVVVGRVRGNNKGSAAALTT